MALRWIDYSRVSMQRAGALVAVAAGAGSRPTDLAGVSRSYAPFLQQVVPVPEASRAEVASYLRQLRLWKRYRDLREVDELPQGARIEIQDLWLADPRVPSATGAVTNDVIDELPQLATSLRLLREKNYTLTDRGKALLAAANPPPRDTPPDDLRSRNIFILGTGARAILLYALLDADFDFVRSAFFHAPTSSGEFTRATFADSLNVACRDLKAQWVRRARTGTERKLLMRLDALAKEIDKPRGTGKNWGGGRPPDQTATLRLEPYVDLGLLTKESRTAYRYSISGMQRRFFSGMFEADDADRFLDSGVFRTYLDALGKEPRLATQDELWNAIVDAYSTLRSPLGFAAFREVALLGLARLLEHDDGTYYEIADAVEALKAKRAENPRALRFGVARGGALTYMKLVEEKAAR